MPADELSDEPAGAQALAPEDDEQFLGFTSEEIAKAQKVRRRLVDLIDDE